MASLINLESQHRLLSQAAVHVEIVEASHPPHELCMIQSLRRSYDHSFLFFGELISLAFSIYSDLRIYPFW